MYENPFFRKFEVAAENERPASYGGIATKSIWYLTLTLVGVACFLWLPGLENKMAMLIGCAGIATLLPFIIFFFPGTSALLGSVYSAAQGYLVGLVSTEYAKQYSGIVAIALVITAIVFVSLLLLYSNGIIKVGHKFKAVYSRCL